VRRTALLIEQSLSRGTQWAAFEPNDTLLWQRLQRDVDAFMHGLFGQGAFQGNTANQAYFVRCDASTTTPADIIGGVVNILVGFAPVKPAEFVVISIQQIAGGATA
jgi:phage tail sheath protein FI